jgi:hypothetical protein
VALADQRSQFVKKRQVCVNEARLTTADALAGAWMRW